MRLVERASPFSLEEVLRAQWLARAV